MCIYNIKKQLLNSTAVCMEKKRKLQERKKKSVLLLNCSIVKLFHHVFYQNESFPFI